MSKYLPLIALCCACAEPPTPPSRAAPPAPPPPAATATVPRALPSPAAPAPVSLEVPAPPDPLASRYALIAIGTRLRERPDAASPGVPFDRLRDPKTGQPRDNVVSVRVVDDSKDFVEIETVPVEDGGPSFHCHGGGHPGLRNIALGAFVKKDELSTVTTKTSELDLGGRTGVVVQPGIQVVAKGGRYTALTYPELPLRLPADVVGKSYTPVPNFTRGRTHKGLSEDAPKTSLRLGNGVMLESYQGHHFDAVEEAPGGYTAFLHSECVRYRFFVPKRWMIQHEPMGTDPGLGTLAADDPGGPRVMAGATAYWESGAPAGFLRATQTFREDAGTKAGRRCLRKSILSVRKGSGQTTLPEHDFVLCFDPAQVEGVATPPAQR